MKTDIEIAQSTQMRHIADIAKTAGVDEEYLEFYGKYKAKIDYNLLREMERICDHRVIATQKEAEPIGPKGLLDLLIIAPCTGSTLGKLACGIADTTVTLAAKAHLRNCRPILLAPSTNDGLAASARNLGQLMARKYIYLVPFRQDDPEEKPASLVADFSLVADAAQAALEGRQLQPVLLGPAAP